MDLVECYTEPGPAWGVSDLFLLGKTEPEQIGGGWPKGKYTIRVNFSECGRSCSE
jgi:hypothetical protein